MGTAKSKRAGKTKLQEAGNRALSILDAQSLIPLPFSRREKGGSRRSLITFSYATVSNAASARVSSLTVAEAAI